MVRKEGVLLVVVIRHEPPGCPLWGPTATAFIPGVIPAVIISVVVIPEVVPSKIIPDEGSPEDGCTRGRLCQR